MKKLVVGSLLFCASVAHAEDVYIEGTVESRCMITTDTPGVYGNPTPYELSTAPADGGVVPIVRYDVITGDYYKAVISHPDSFSSSPTLDDITTWTGEVSVEEVSDTAMSDYETNKVEYSNVTEFELTTAGTTWFSVDSSVEYGAQTSLPAGDYVAIVEAECVAL